MLAVNAAVASLGAPRAGVEAGEGSVAATSVVHRGTSLPAEPGQMAKQVVDVSDSLAVLFTMAIECEACETEDKLTRIAAQATAARAAMQRARQAAEQARDAAQDKSFWSGLESDLKTAAKIAAVGAGVASMAATGGLSTVGVMSMAGVLLSVSAKPIGDAAGNESLGRALGYGGLALNLAAGGVALGGVDGALTTMSVSESEASTAHEVASVATAGSGALTAGSGISHAMAARDGARSMRAEAEGRRQRAHQRASQREIEALTDGLKRTQESFQRAKSYILDGIDEQGRAERATLQLLGRQA